MRRLTTLSAISRSSHAGCDFGGAAASISAIFLPEGASAMASDAPTRPPPTMTTSASATHQRFDLADFLRHAGGQHARALVGHQHVVLDAHADAPVLLVRALGARRDVQARLH